MPKIKDNIIKYQYFLLGFLIISIPFLDFIKVNYYSLDKVMYKNILSYLVLTLLISSAFFLLLRQLISNSKDIIGYILTFSIFFWLLFKFEYIQNFLFEMGHNKLDRNNLTAEISLLLIVFISLLFLNKNLTKFLYNFIIIFFIAQHFFIYLTLAKNILFSKFNNNHSKIKYNNKNFFSDDEINFIKINKKNNKNIYYLVIDEMTSLKEYKNLGGQENTNEWIKYFESHEYTYISNTYSTFNDTNTTFGSIFNLNPILTENSNISDNQYTELTFPTALSKDQFNIKQYPKLNNILQKINYKFKWIGNYKYNCKIYNENLCIEYNDQKSNNNFFSKNINFYLLKIFLENTPIQELYKIYHKRFSQNIKINKPKKILDDDAIEKFILKVKKFHNNNFRYFYFLHDHLFKEPYPFDSNCNRIDYDNVSNDIKINISQYIKNYDCIIKKINKFILFLDENDPEAIVIIQSDHGFRAPYKNHKNLKRYEIFNLIKAGIKCNDKISNEIDNVNSVRLALTCATSVSPKLIEKKTHYTNRRKVKNYEIIEINRK